MSYGLFAAGRKTVLVFDMGGGTTDASVICIDEGEYKVAAVNGHSACGGQDFDDVLFGIVTTKLGKGWLPSSKLCLILSQFHCAIVYSIRMRHRCC
jgi:molecular chaperone DnaK (HSP70)